MSFASFVASTTRDHPLLTDFLEAIPFLRLDLRKCLIDALRIGDPIREQPRISSQLLSLLPPNYCRAINLPSGKLISASNLTRYIDSMQHSTLQRSMAVMYLHCTNLHPSISDESEVLSATFQKELMASQKRFKEEQAYSYSAWFNRENAIPPSRFTTLHPAWTDKASSLANTFLDRFSDLRHRTIFPVVSRNKNLSYSTGYRAAMLGWGGDPKMIRSVDLEVFSYRTGERVGGECEMRSAWRYNDVKPRVYYSMGGDDYWAARYMKVLASVMMECNRTTSERMRNHPEQLLHLENDNFSVWDYASFTTTLSELRYFLYHFARYLKDHTHPDHLQPFFDYRDGITRHNLGDIILQYNEQCNTNAAFTIWRLGGLCGGNEVFPELYRQENSGMLGVPGNIGFSTSLHGVAMMPVIKDGGCSGDDAVAEHEVGRGDLLGHLGEIGDPQPSKSASFPDRDIRFGSRVPEVWKYLKRRLEIFEFHIELGHLFSIPNYAIAMGDFSDNRRVLDKSLMGSMKTVLPAVGSLLWDIHAHSYLVTDDSDLVLLFSFLRRIYSRLRLPTRGCLPGRLTNHPYVTSPDFVMAVPPLDGYDPRTTDWCEYLYDTHLGFYFSAVVLSPHEIMPPSPMREVDEFLATSGGLMNVLVDLEVVVKLGVTSEILLADEDNRRRFLKSFGHHTKKEHLVYRYCCPDTSLLPRWYYSAVEHLSIVEAVPDVSLEATFDDEDTDYTVMYGCWKL